MTVVKAIVALLGAILAAILPALTTGPLDASAWVNIVILAAGTAMVYNAANVPGWDYAKLVAAVVSAVAVVLSSALSGGISPAEIVQMIVAGIAALGVGVLPNAGARTAV